MKSALERKISKAFFMTKERKRSTIRKTKEKRESMGEIRIRPVTEGDAEELLAIYAPYVT